jgi:hypothetical protein
MCEELIRRYLLAQPWQHLMRFNSSYHFQLPVFAACEHTSAWLLMHFRQQRFSFASLDAQQQALQIAGETLPRWGEGAFQRNEFTFHSPQESVPI